MPYTANNAIDICLLAGFYCTALKNLSFYYFFFITFKSMKLVVGLKLCVTGNSIPGLCICDIAYGFAMSQMHLIQYEYIKISYSRNFSHATETT